MQGNILLRPEKPSVTNADQYQQASIPVHPDDSALGALTRSGLATHITLAAFKYPLNQRRRYFHAPDLVSGHGINTDYLYR
jgi:hypothetical protein